MMLELRDIYKTYLQGKMEVPVLRGVSLSVEEGEYLAIMGPSGSGKTTLMNIIGCLDSPTSGEYILDHEDIGKISEKRMSEVRLHSIGFVFQSFYLLSRQSALENVALPLLYAGVRRRERQEIARRALERVGLGDRTEFKPTQLSGGQCQRVAIARSIVNNPKILLADEPTGALDTRSGEQIMEIFQRLNDEGVTIVMITHEPEIAAHAKRTLHIRDGLLGDGQSAPAKEAPEQSISAQSAPAEGAPEQSISAQSVPAEGAPEQSGLDSSAPAPEKSLPEKSLPEESLPEKPKGRAWAPAFRSFPWGRRSEHKAGGTDSMAAQQPDPSQKEPAEPEKPPKAEASSPPQPAAQPSPGPEKALEEKPPKEAEPSEEGELFLDGQSIIAALERQCDQLTQNAERAARAETAPKGGEELSHEQ